MNLVRESSNLCQNTTATYVLVEHDTGENKTIWPLVRTVEQSSMWQDWIYIYKAHSTSEMLWDFRVFSCVLWFNCGPTWHKINYDY